VRSANARKHPPTANRERDSPAAPLFPFSVEAEAFIVGLVEPTVAGLVVAAGELGLAVDRVDAGFDVDENTYTGVPVFDVKKVVGIRDVGLGAGVV